MSAPTEYRWHPCGVYVTDEAIVRDGWLRVTAHYLRIRDPHGHLAWQITHRWATLNGLMIATPLRSQALTTEAGIPDPPQYLTPP